MAQRTIEEYLDKALLYIDEVFPQLHSYEPESSVDDNEYYVVSQARYANLVRGIRSSLVKAKLDVGFAKIEARRNALSQRARL